LPAQPRPIRSPSSRSRLTPPLPTAQWTPWFPRFLTNGPSYVPFIRRIYEQALHVVIAVGASWPKKYSMARQRLKRTLHACALTHNGSQSCTPVLTLILALTFICILHNGPQHIGGRTAESIALGFHKKLHKSCYSFDQILMPLTLIFSQKAYEIRIHHF